MRGVQKRSWVKASDDVIAVTCGSDVMYPCFKTFDVLVVLNALSRLQYAHLAG